jgi:hypothetical protein
MAQVMHCENPMHDQPTEGFVMIQFLGSPDTQVTCVPCWEEWCWSFLEKLPTFDDRIKTYAGAVIAQYQEEKAAQRRAAREAKGGKAEPKDTSAEIAAGESTATGE